MSPLPPPHSDDESVRGTKKAVEMPVHVQLETEPPQRKPGRPRLDISANFQDTGEMANHSHRLVWCIACIKSGRPMYRRDRMPARGDLMLRHLQACKYVEDSVKQRFRKNTPPARSASVSSSGESKARKAGVASAISEPGPMSSAVHHHYQNNTIATGSRGGYHHGQHQRPETAPVTLPSIATAVSLSPVGGVGQLSLTMPPPPPLPLRPPYSMGSSHSPSNPENQLPRIRSPQMRSTASMELPSITRRPHPYLNRAEPYNGHRHASPAPPALRGTHGSPPTHLGLRVSPESASRTPSSVHTSSPLPAAAVASVNPLRRRLGMGSAALGIVLQIASADSARLAARLGYDWACVDVGEEHFARGPAGSSVMAAMVAAICASSAVCAAVVRLPHSQHWPAYLWAAVEAGAHAVIAPGISDYEHMCAVVAECRRASAAAATAQGSIDGPARDVLVIPQIDYMEAIDDILSADGVDAAMISYLPQVTADRALRAAYHRAVPAGVDCRDAGAARRMVAQGFRIATVATDADLLQAAATDQLRLAQAP
ncbi:hypothetical protein H4218_003936 [Coemansia sp. IMI 209128]|nr:hypothetical protein H4218_003936 [Coemansia sp. IMI 209128]